jgi:hypothetical protein
MSAWVQGELWTDPPERRRQRRAELRRRVFEVYGTRCICCGSGDDLTLDHPDGDGAEHRRELFGTQTGGHHFYRWLDREGWPGGYVTMCHPCNRSKATGDRCRLDHTGDPAPRRTP